MHLYPSSKIIELIYTTEMRGDGTSSDPIRRVHVLHRKDGEVVMAYDPCGLVSQKTNKPVEMKVIYNENLEF